MGRFKHTGSKKTCPVCHGERDDCRELETTTGTLYFCRTDNPSPDVVFRKYDIHNFGIFVKKTELDAQDKKQREEWQRQRQAEKEARLKAEKERRAKLLSEVERDWEIRKIFNQLPLKPHHHKDLERRGLTPKQIKQGMFCSVEQWQKLSEPVSYKLAGVNISGRSLITQAGYICPIWNDFGLIIGWQLRVDNTDDGGKYRWPTSNTRKRPNGPTAHLQNGELPLTIHIAKGDKNLRLAEGVLKPYIAHCRRNQTYIGAAGGQFNQSKELLKRYIKQIQPEKIILTPDAGSRANKNVLRQYRKIANLLKSWKKELWVEDWGQGDSKDNCDVDEIEPNTKTTIIPFSEWDVPESTSDTKQQQYKAKQIPKQEWWEKRKFPTEVNNLAKFVRGKLKKFSQILKPQNKEYKGFLNPVKDYNKPNTTTTAITLWSPPLKLGRPYITYTGPNSIPTKSEYQKLLKTENWLIKQPEIKFDLRKWGDAPAREAIAKGWNLILDKHGCGEGKSYVYGSLTAAKLEGIQQTIFAASNHRNPTVKTVESRKDLIAKHSGLTYDYSKQTPSGRPYQIATPSGKTPNIEPPCVEHKLFNTAYALQLNAYSGKGSPTCQKCSFFSNCDYLNRRGETLGTEKIKDDLGNTIAEIPNHPDIRADLNGLNQFKIPTALIIDEIDQTLESSKPIYITRDTIARGNMKLALLSDEKLSKVLQKLCQKIYQIIDTYQSDNKYGLDYIQVMEKLAEVSIPAHKWLSSEEKYQQYLLYKANDNFHRIIEEIYSDKLVDPKVNLWGEVKYIYKTDRDPITGEIIIVEEKPTKEILPTIPSLSDLISQCQKLLKTNFDEIIDSKMTPGEKAEALELNHTLDFLSPILKVINGYKKVSFSLTKNCLTITKPWYRHQNLVKSAAVNIFLDATIDVKDLKRKLMLNNLENSEPILVFSSLEKDHSNVNLKFMQDFGHASNQRRNGSQYTETERIAAFINQIAENHKGEKIGFIDYKQYAYSHNLPENSQVGHWGYDSRGSNQFLDCTVMVNIGDYTENLGALAANWQCMTGQIVSPSKLTGAYGRYVQRRRIADLEQVIGRPRATNRPDEQITIYLPGKWTDDEISAIASRLPGVNIEKVATYDVCPTAARKGEQVNRKIIETFWDLTIQGQKITQEKIAQIVGLARSRVAQICKTILPVDFVRFKKMLVLLWDTLNKTNIPEKALSELPEDAQWFVTEWLPNFHEYVAKGENVEDMAKNLEMVVELHGKSIFDYVSVDTIIDLIKLFMAAMPISFWESLGMQVELMPIPIEN